MRLAALPQSFTTDSADCAPMLGKLVHHLILFNSRSTMQSHTHQGNNFGSKRVSYDLSIRNLITNPLTQYLNFPSSQQLAPLPKPVYSILLFRRSPSQSLMQMRWEAVTQLAGVRGEVERNLFQLLDHQSSGPLVPAELSVAQLFSLPHTADNCPHE